MGSNSQQIDVFFADYISRFLSENEAARYIANELSNCGVGLMPLIDHCTLRTLDVDKQAEDLFPLGFSHDQTLGTLEFDNWWAKIYRKPGYPSLFVDQTFAGERGVASLITDWVHTHGDQCFHHIDILVEDIDHAIEKMKSRKIEFLVILLGPQTRIYDRFLLSRN
jgi:hypothetical protein